MLVYAYLTTILLESLEIFVYDANYLYWKESGLRFYD